MDRWIGKVAIVTGASSGIGEAIVKILVKHGVNILGLARRVERLQELAKDLEECKGLFTYMCCDVQNEKDILQAFEYVEKTLGPVDILINNAGVVKICDFQDTSTEDFHAVMNVNVIATAVFCREALKSMRKNSKCGHIININSVYGHYSKRCHQDFPINLYPASKFAMRAMTDNLRLDIANAKDNIRVTSIYPGLVKTEHFFMYANEFDQNLGATMPFIEGNDVADSVVYVLSVPPNVQIEDIVVTPLHNVV